MIIRSEEIYKKANSIVKSCGTRDTLKIARELGIHLHFLDNLNDLLGMYTYRHKERHILLNSNMEYLIMQMVCGHEIGHDTFHRDLAKGNEPLPEFVLFDMRTKHEYEANAFASHLIIDDDELIDLMKQNYDVVQLSAAMGTNINLMLIKLNELNYLEAAKFYPDKTPDDKAAHYAVFGGSPFVNQALQPTATIRENIISTILNPMSAVYLYASQLLLSDYSVKINAERIFSVIGNGKKRYTEIEDKLDVKKTGNLSKQIKSLIDLEIIARNSPINKIGDNKKSTFEINDNLLRFYFTFIYKNASALQVLGAEAFYDEYIAPALTDFISRRFEGICRDYFSHQVRSGKMKGVRNIGSYYYDDPAHRKNGEFDVALEFADG